MDEKLPTNCMLYSYFLQATKQKAVDPLETSTGLNPYAVKHGNRDLIQPLNHLKPPTQLSLLQESNGALRCSKGPTSLSFQRVQLLEPPVKLEQFFATSFLPELRKSLST